MAKRYIVLFLCVCVLVQHVHLRRVEIAQQRARWDEIRLSFNSAHAFVGPYPFPAAAAPAAAVAPIVAPYVLAALVVVGAAAGAYWLWNHGGKTATIVMAKALKNGQPITQQWVIDAIAELNGLPPSGDDDFDGSDGRITYDGTTYVVGPVMNGGYAGYAISYMGQTRVYAAGDLLYVGETWGGSFWWCKNYQLISSGPAQGLNPADHPELYDDEHLLDNCKNLAKEHPDIDYYYYSPETGLPPNAAQQVKPSPKIVAMRPDGTFVDETGRVWPSLVGLDPFWGDVPMLDPATEGQQDFKEDGQDLTKIVPKTFKDRLDTSGVRGPITGVGPNYIDWQGDYGPPTRTYVDPLLAQEASKYLTPKPSPTGGGGFVNPSDPEIDPGNPIDPELPIVPEFLPDIDWGEEKTWPWQQWIGYLPFVDVLKGSRISTSSGSSSINLNLTLLGQSRAMSYDFAAWETIFNAMGLIIYACSCWYALQLAILKRD